MPPDDVVQEDDEILADSERLVALHHDPAPGAMVRIALAPCSPFSVTPELMARTAELAERLDVRLHTHLAEDAGENDYCQAAFGCRPVEHFERVGWGSDRAWVAHCVHPSEEEIERLGRWSTGVAHCPSSNQILGAGLAPVRELRDAGVPVGISAATAPPRRTARRCGWRPVARCCWRVCAAERGRCRRARRWRWRPWAAPPAWGGTTSAAWRRGVRATWWSGRSPDRCRRHRVRRGTVRPRRGAAALRSGAPSPHDRRRPVAGERRGAGRGRRRRDAEAASPHRRGVAPGGHGELTRTTIALRGQPVARYPVAPTC